MIYLDYNATTPVAPDVLEAMMPYLGGSFGNPSSSHAKGRESRYAIEGARASVAALLGAKYPSEITFTSGGTEGDNWAILSALEAAPDKRHIITTPIEHEAVRKLVQKLESSGFDVTWLGVDSEGMIDLDELAGALREDTAVVSIMMANNETGVLLPVSEAAEIVKKGCSALFHVDGVNATGKVPIDLSATEIDLFSLSAHKFHGPKGVGALFIRHGVELPSSVIGGGQENGRRAGTSPVHQIVGMGVAAQLAADLSMMADVRCLRDELENALLAMPRTCRNGPEAPEKRLPNTANISFENTNGEMILYGLDERGICVSTGSACHSRDHSTSNVLEAMDVPHSYAMGSIRFSLGRSTTREEIDATTAAVAEVVAALRNAAAAGNE